MSANHTWLEIVDVGSRVRLPAKALGAEHPEEIVVAYVVSKGRGGPHVFVKAEDGRTFTVPKMTVVEVISKP